VFFLQAEDGIRDRNVTGVQTCALPILARSEGGRSVDLLRFGRTDGGAQARVLLTCRHHSCEMMASHVLEGAMEHVLGSADPAAQDRKSVVQGKSGALGRSRVRKAAVPE